MNLNKNRVKLHYKMHKSGKNWIIVGVLTLSFGISLSNVFSDQKVNADSQSVTTSNNQNYNSSTASSASLYNQSNVSSSVISSTAALSTTNASSISSDSSSDSTIKQSSANSSSFYATSDEEKLMTSATFNQNFHYNTPRGYSNDVQSILPHVNSDGKTDYYDIYYLYNPNPSQISFGNEWYHVRTTDFKTFSPLDTNNPASVNNVAIPEPDFKDSNGNVGSQIASNNKNGIPWNYVATGSVIYNNGLLTKDEWGNSIDYDAKLAYFTSFINGSQSSYLAYSNKDQQFHPYNNGPILPESLSAGRDFYVERVDHKLVGYLAAGYNSKMYIITSTDGVNWHYDQSNDINLGTELGQKLPTESETPIIKTVNGHSFMFYSWHYNDYRGNAAISGKLNKNGLFQLNKNSKLYTLDGSPYKGDTYAGNYTNIDNDTLINVNWSGNWEYSGLFNQYSFTRHSGTIALPRLVQYKNGNFIFTPVEPNNKLIVSYKTDKNSSNSPIVVTTNNKLDFSFDNPANKKTLYLSRADSNILITIGNGKLRLVRNNSLNDNLQKDVTIPIDTKNIRNLQMYVDNSSIELYLPDVGKSYNIVNFTNSQNEPYKMIVKAKATINNYEFNSTYPALSSDGLKASIKKLINGIKHAQSNVNLLKNESKVYYLKHSKNRQQLKSNSKLANNQLSNAVSSISVANSYVSRANKMAGDARSSLYLTLASSAYASAATDANYATQSIINSNNLINNKSDKLVKTLISNKDNAQFISGKQVIGKVITDNVGNEHYYDSLTGRKFTNFFYLNNGKYYYFDNKGNMVKNDFIESFPGTNQFYYFGKDGAALTGKQSVNDSNYMFGSDGIQLKNALIVNGDGTLSYYLPNNGLEATTNASVFGTIFNFSSDGVLNAKNQFVISPSEFNVIYYLDDTGHVAKGYKQINGYSYYFGQDGKEYINRFLKDNSNKIIHYFDNSGHMVKDAYIASNNEGTDFYYFDGNGNAVYGPQIIGGNYQLFSSNGIQLKGRSYVNDDGTISYYDAGNGNLVTGSVTINNVKYNFSSDGKLVAPDSFVEFQNDNNITYYLDGNSQITRGFKTINGNQYYFDNNGHMLINSKINDNNGKTYIAADNGVLTVKTNVSINSANR